MVVILYWNTRNGTPAMEIALQDDYDIIAVQEPGRVNKSVYCPRAGNYHAVYGGGRAAILINKRYAIDSWTSQAQEDWCSITLKGASIEEDLTIYSVYSPNPMQIAKVG
jgi:hypothetical protein